MNAADAISRPGSDTRPATGIPLSAYVHLPWCIKKCPYCDFNSHRAPNQLPERAYVDALLADWSLASAGETRPIQSVFFGGGTPSLFSAAAIGRILDAIAVHPGLTADCEITLEANPGTTERQRFAGLHAAGVNRLSLGIQSLNDDCLKALGRIHDAQDALAAIDDARAAGFAALNCDLMFGLPGQSLAGALQDIETVLDRDPGHISYYQLTLEPGTPFHKRPPARPGEDTVADMFEAASARLEAAGYRQYEVSAWARQDQTCRHNENYWRFGDYLGIGAGAHGKTTDQSGQITRTARLRWPTGYMHSAGKREALAERQTPTAADTRFECLLVGLRRRAGITRVDYEARTGLQWPALLRDMQKPISRGLLVGDHERLRATDRGWYFLDSILADCLP